MAHLQGREGVGDETPVTHVRVVVHSWGSFGPSFNENHWSIYLVHTGAETSTHINMNPDYGHPDGRFEWTRVARTESRTGCQYWDFPTAPGLTVSHFARLIYTLSRDRYDMSGRGSRSRWWIWTVFSDFAQMNYVDPNARYELWPNLLFSYHRTNGRVRQPMVVGRFF